jgi:hypothetical protein
MVVNWRKRLQFWKNPVAARAYRGLVFCIGVNTKPMQVEGQMAKKAKKKAKKM